MNDTAVHPPDRQLAARVMESGDERAFRTLYRRHTPALYPFVLRLLGGDEGDAEDVVQETWVRAVEALPGFRWEAAFRTWLTGIALNRCRELLRRSARRDERPIEPGDGADARFVANAGIGIDLERAIATLPEGYRTVLVLHDVEGYTHPEISERLEIAIGTSRSQLHHARRRLRRLLAPQTIEEEAAP